MERRISAVPVEWEWVDQVDRVENECLLDLERDRATPYGNLLIVCSRESREVEQVRELDSDTRK